LTQSYRTKNTNSFLNKSKVINFKFNAENYQGYEGDTL